MSVIGTLLSMDEVAARLGGGKPIAQSTLYGILKRIELDNPGVPFSRKVGRVRMFTERDYQFIVEQIAWRSSSSRLESEDRSMSSEARSTDDAMNSLRRRQTRTLLKTLRSGLKANSTPGGRKVVPLHSQKP